MRLKGFQFGDFVLDLQAHELRSSGRAIKLERIAMKLLILLVENRGKPVSREFIAAQLWGNAAYLESEHSLNTAINKLRRVLKEDRDAPRFIQSIAGEGYRFIAEVRVEEALREDVSRRPQHAAGSGTALGEGLISLSIRALRSRALKATRRTIASLAVLPFSNLSPRAERDGLADGITDELIGALVRQTPVRVVSRNSVMQFQGTRTTLPRIAKRLHVDAVIEGTVVHAGDRVRISAQMIDPRRSVPLRSNVYDRRRSNLSEVQREVTRDITCQIAARIDPTAD